MLRRGTIIKWDDIKAYGFIAPDDGTGDVFLHLRAVADPARRPQVGDRVHYEVGLAIGKGLRAERATLRAGPNLPPSAGASHRRPDRAARRAPESGASPAAGVIVALLLPASVLGALWIAATRGVIPPWVSLLYVVTSLLAFTAYALDKYRAQQGQWRVSESTLHLFEMAGGWPGAFAAQRLLRHKNRKTSFQVAFWLIVASHLAFWAWFIAEENGWTVR